MPDAGRRAVIAANARAAQWRPRERQDDLFKLFKKDEPVSISAYEVCPTRFVGGGG
jgi:hypothetical protein